MVKLNDHIFSWSGGKDSAFALYKLKKGGKASPRALLTTVTKDYSRISMHGVRESLLEKQAGSLGIKLEKVYITKFAGNTEYETAMRKLLIKYSTLGVTHVVFGDIFLEDLKKYRVAKLKEAGLRGVFPLWNIDTRSLSRSFIKQGFKAVVTCADTDHIPASFCGREYNEAFLDDLPENVDPCGENGEFHTFVYDGPNFSRPVAFKPGRKVLKNKRFLFCDLVPAN